QLRVAQYNGTSFINPATSAVWAPTDAVLNVSTSAWAQDAAITLVGTAPYIAWTEHTAGAAANSLYVASLSGTTWTTSNGGVTLTRDPVNGYAFHPRLASDGTHLWMAWEEQNLGSVNKVYVSELSGGSWSSLGGALNIDATNGTAKNVSLALLSGQPVVCWNGIQLGQTMQIYCKQWNGTSWTSSFGGTAPAVTLSPTSIAFGS